MVIAILALQGAFAEHGKVLDKLRVEHFEIRKKKDLEREFDALIVPGGESTVIGKLLRELELMKAASYKNTIRNAGFWNLCRDDFVGKGNRRGKSVYRNNEYPCKEEWLRQTAWKLLYGGEMEGGWDDSHDLYPGTVYRRGHGGNRSISRSKWENHRRKTGKAVSHSISSGVR